MQSKTHLIITIFFVLLLLPFIYNKVIFVVLALLATYIPDIDLENSKLGKKKIFRPLQFFVSHRGFLHSFTFLFFVVLILLLIFPILALGFFVGYSSHLLADCFTPQGIYAFYPLKKRFYGKIGTGSNFEKILFFCLLVLAVLLAVNYVIKYVF